MVGSRDFDNINLMHDVLSQRYGTDIHIVSGGARGADKLAEQYAKEHDLEITVLKPDWKKYRKGAGLIRNTAIVELADEVCAFWNGQSKGTQDSIEKAKFLKKPVHVVLYEQQ